MILTWILTIPAFVLAQLSFWRSGAVFAAEATVSTTTEDIAAAEAAAAAKKAARLAEVEKKQDKVDDLESQLAKELKEKASLEKNLTQILGSVNATQAEINKAQKSIRDVEENIARKEAEIRSMEEKMSIQQDRLRKIIQELYYAKKNTGVNLVLSDGEFADILSTSDNLIALEERVINVAKEISNSKEKIAGEKNELADAKDSHEELLKEKSQQKQELIADKVDVQGDIQQQEATIGELQAKLDDLKNDLSNLLGKNLSTNDIVEAAGIAAKATGVRKDFILGELVVETNLGTFTGGCTYKNIRMRSADKAAFLALAAELEKAYGGNYKNKKLSCSPGYGYGGAMGVAQFMPTTWTGYKSYIAGATGHNPPDPWSIIDGVMGMARKLANGGATSKSGEKLASKRYYCGGPSSPYWNNKCNAYANNVQYWADNYEKKL